MNGTLSFVNMPLYGSMYGIIYFSEKTKIYKTQQPKPRIGSANFRVMEPS